MVRDFVDALAHTAGRFPWKLAAPWALAATFALVLAVPSASADVVAAGDVLPTRMDPETMVEVPDLPIGGGTVTAEIVVGGTDQFIGDTDTGLLIIDAPAATDPLISPSGIIGDEAEGSGLVQILSLGSVWRVTNTFTVGQEGQGTLELINGGQLSENPNNPITPSLAIVVGELLGSQGFINARGTGSLLRSDTLVIGEEGFGQMTLTTRARVNTLTESIIGEVVAGTSIGTGFVSVTDPLTRWTIGSSTDAGNPGLLVVGDAGRGALTVSNQGEVRVSDDSGIGGSLVVGRASGGFGEVTVSGQFSQIWSFGTITVGATNNARGVLRATAGGLIRANQAIGIGVDGVLEISGGTVLTPVAINNSGTIQTAVGNIGQIDSIVNNLAGGEIRAAGTEDRVRERLIFTKGVANSGLVTSIGGEMEFTGGITNTGLIAGRDAIYRFRDPFTNAGSFSFSVGASDVFGTITNNGVIGVANETQVTFYGPVINNANLTVLPGGSAIFLQNLNLSQSSVLSIHLNEVANVAQLAQIDVLGDLPLLGRLNVLAGMGLDPEPGDSFQIISGTNITGTFSEVTFPPAPGNNWRIAYTPQSVILNYVAAPAFNADFNNDNVVDALDLAVIRANFGLMPAATRMQGDADGDGDVDGNDMQIWQRTLGPVMAVAAVGAVPEPSSLVMLLSALGCVALSRRRLTA